MTDDGKTAVVLGGGTMGAGIALVFAAAGWRTHVVEPSPQQRATLPARWRDELASMGKPAAAGQLLQLHTTIETLPWQDISIVSESISEDLELKQQLFRQIETLARPGTLLTSNSSTYQIDAVAAGMKQRDHAAGLHFLMPANFVPLVEIIPGAATAPAVVERLHVLMIALDKMPVTVKKGVAGFLANRLQHAVLREAYALIAQGVATAQDIDTAIRYGFGFRYIAAGPILQKEFSGIDISYRTAALIYPELCNDRQPARILAERVEAGHLGMKTKQGFYYWTDESITAAKARYDALLGAAMKILMQDRPGAG